MGKCTRKSEVTVDVSVVDVSQSYLRTRAKTLAIQRRQSAAAAALPPPNPDACYLDLRSRRLEKPMQPQKSRIVRHGCGCEGPRIEGREGFSRVSGSIGENNLDFEGGESQRGTRESTPCSLVKAVDASTNTTPSSTTMKPCLDYIGQRVFPTNVPPHELEEFFAIAERSIQDRFLDKYNFDSAREVPLPGRFEWVAVGL